MLAFSNWSPFFRFSYKNSVCIFNLPHMQYMPYPSDDKVPYTIRIFLLQCERPSFTPIQNNRQNCKTVYSDLYTLDSKLENIRFCTEWQLGVPEFNLLLNLFTNEILIRYVLSQIFKLIHPITELITCLHVVFVLQSDLETWSYT
jgi:hypothetical protein